MFKIDFPRMLYFHTIPFYCLVFSVKCKFSISFKRSEALLVGLFLLVFDRIDLGNEKGSTLLVYLLIYVSFEFLLISICFSSNIRQIQEVLSWIVVFICTGYM